MLISVLEVDNKLLLLLVELIAMIQYGQLKKEKQLAKCVQLENQSDVEALSVLNMLSLGKIFIHMLNLDPHFLNNKKSLDMVHQEKGTEATIGY